MNCNELKRRLQFGQPRQRITILAMHEHAAGCQACRQLLAAESLAEALVKANHADEFEPSSFWAGKLRHRIQEMRDQRVHSWESQLMGLRGWLTALGAAAMLLLALSAQWRPARQTESNLPETVLEEATLHASVDDLIGGRPESGNAPSNLYE